MRVYVALAALIALAFFTFSTAKAEGFSLFQPRSSLVSIARADIGKGPRQMGVPSRLWCADAMNVWLRRAGYKGTGSRAARSFKRYGQRLSGPQAGAIVVFPRGRSGGHVGVISAVNGSTIRVISGNHNNRVAEADYPTARAIAFVRPQ